MFPQSAVRFRCLVQLRVCVLQFALLVYQLLCEQYALLQPPLVRQWQVLTDALQYAMDAAHLALTNARLHVRLARSHDGQVELVLQLRVRVQLGAQRLDLPVRLRPVLRRLLLHRLVLGAHYALLAHLRLQLCAHFGQLGHGVLHRRAQPLVLEVLDGQRLPLLGPLLLPLQLAGAEVQAQLLDRRSILRLLLPRLGHLQQRGVSRLSQRRYVALVALSLPHTDALKLRLRPVLQTLQLALCKQREGGCGGLAV